MVCDLSVYTRFLLGEFPKLVCDLINMQLKTGLKEEAVVVASWLPTIRWTGLDDS